MENEEYIKMLKFKLIFIVWMIGAFLVSLTYLLLNTNMVFDNLMFWTGILLAGISTYIIISGDNKIQTKLCLLFLFGLVLYIPHTLSSPNHYHLYDEMNHYQSSSLVYENGNLDINSSFTISRYYPTLEILTVFFKNITRDSIFSSGLIIIGIIHSFTVIFLYLFFRNICSDKIASIGTFAYFFNSGYTYVDTYVSYESIGFPLLVICLFAISYNYNKIRMVFVQFILIFGLVVTHHFSSYMLLLFMVIFLYAKRKNDDIYKRIRLLTLLTITLISAWIIYIAPRTLKYYYNIFNTSYEGVANMFLFKERVSELLSSSFQSIPYFELFIRRYIYIPLILIFLLTGIYYLKNEKKLEGYILTMIAFSIIFFISLLGAMTSSFEISRFATYGFMGVALFIGVSINKFNKKKNLRLLTIIPIILLLIGSISMGTSSPYRGSYSDNIRVGQQTITADSISSAEWSEKHMGRYNMVASDLTTSAVIEYYGIQRVVTNWEIFYPTEVDSSVLYHLRYNNVGYLVTDIRITKYFPELHYYFDRDELHMNGSYGRKKPFPLGLLKKFDDSEIFLKIYDNGNINIYKIYDRKRNNAL